RPVKDRQMAEACLAGLWLWCDFLDESHRISQSLDTVEGSYWHAMMHRREPDYDNAKYWFRRVGQHPVYTSLVEGARRLTAADESDSQWRFLANQGQWDPFRFVDLCRASAPAVSPGNLLCRSVQQLEWQLLFDYCFQQASGSDA